LFGGFAATMAESDFSRSCIGGYGSSPSRRGPSAQYSLRPTWRSPGSRAWSVRACQVLRPRRVAQVLALALLDILPSATQTASAPGISFLSRLNGWPARSPADASPTSSRMPAHGLGPMWFCYSFIVVDLHHLLLAGLPAHLCENARSNLRRATKESSLRPWRIFHARTAFCLNQSCAQPTLRLVFTQLRPGGDMLQFGPLMRPCQCKWRVGTRGGCNVPHSVTTGRAGEHLPARH
jgi:hypothetical protein